MSSPHERLRRRLDELPIPFPESETGSEIRLLRALFSEEEAEIAIHLSAVPEPPETIHPRVAQLVPDLERLSATLERLGRKGAINVSLLERSGKRVKCYGLAPLVVGMFEFQVNRLTQEFVRDFHDYLDHGFRESLVGTKTAQMRTVPVGASISSDRAVGSYDDIRSYIERSPGPFAVMNCVCRQSAELRGHACTTSSTHETCLTVGPGAAATVVAGMSRRIEREEVVEILDRAEREGHVLQPQNSQEPGFICCCCRDCCELLRNARKLSRPSDAIPTAHHAVVDPGQCISCALCVSRCPMDAIVVASAAEVDRDRCIGCGLCVTRCPTGAITLARRQDAKAPPRTTDGMYLRMFRDRFGLFGLLRAGLRKLRGKKI